MTTRIRWQLVLTGITVSLLACEQSITDVPIPEVQFEAAGSVALATHGSCLAPPADLISWWPGDG